MAIPPRPIPSKPTYRRSPRPVGRREAAHITESRAEISLLPPLSLTSSSPNPLRGVHLLSGSAPARPAPLETAREVSLATLISSSERGRPKRVPEATQLGFDFIPRPKVVVMEDKPLAPAPVPPRATFWPWTASTPLTSPLSKDKSPPTPALDPCGDDDWEYVDAEEDDDLVVGELELDLGPEQEGQAKADGKSKERMSYAAITLVS